jgi:hypothetical protein
VAAFIGWPLVAVGAGSIGGGAGFVLVIMLGFMTWPIMIFTHGLIIRVAEPPLRRRWQPNWPSLESLAAAVATFLLMGLPIGLLILGPLGEATGFITAVDCSKVQCDTGSGVN